MRFYKKFMRRLYLRSKNRASADYSAKSRIAFVRMALFSGLFITATFASSFVRSVQNYPHVDPFVTQYISLSRRAIGRNHHTRH
jgi:hypothetical protein